MAEDANLGTASGKIEIDTSDLSLTSRELTSAGRQMIGWGTALASGFVTAVKTSADFETEISAISAVTASSAEDMEILRNAAMQFGQDGPFGPIQVAEAFLELAKAGLTAQEIIEGAGQATINLAKAGDLPVSQAAEIAANTMRTFEIAATDVNEVVDILAGAANQSTLDVMDLATSFRYAGGVAHAVNVPLEEVATALALLGNAGIRGSTGGTSLRRILLQLSPDSKEARQELEKLGIITADGTNKFFDAAGNAKGLDQVIQILADSTANLTNEQKINAINTIFGARASAAALILMEQGAEGFNKMSEAIGKTTAAEVATERLDNLNGSIRRLRAAIQSYLIDAGGPFQTTLKGIVDRLTDFVKWMEKSDSPMTRWILVGTLIVGLLLIMSGGILLVAGAIGKMVAALQVMRAALLLTSGAAAKLAAALWANPIALIILAIIALGVALFILYKKNEGFRKFVDNLWQTIQRVWDKILGFFQALAGWFEDAYNKVAPVVVKIARALADFGQKVKEVWDDVYEKTRGFVEGFIRVTKDIIDFFRDLPGNIKRHVNTAVDETVEFFRELPGRILDAIADLGPKLFKLVVEFFRRLPNAIAYGLGFVLGALIALNIKLFEWALELFFKLGDLFLRGLVRLRDLFIDGLAWLVEKFLEWTGRMLSAATQFASELPGKIVEFLVSLPGRIAELLQLALEKFREWIGNVTNTGLQLGVDFGGKMKEWLLALPGNIQSWLVDSVKAFANFATDVLSEAATMFLKLGTMFLNEAKQLPGMIKTGIGDLSELLVEAGKQAIRGFIKGVKSMATDLFGAAQDAVGSFVNGVADGLRLRSPSRVMMDVGQLAMEGFTLGVQTEMDKVRTLARIMSDEFSRSFQVQGSLTSNLPAGAMLPTVNTTNQVSQAAGNSPTIGKIEINNPTAEPSEESLFLTIHKLAYLGRL